MHGYHLNLEEETKKNIQYRIVLYTSRYTQLVLMSLPPTVEIGNEIHGVDQFIRVESGAASAILNNGETVYELSDGHAVLIPAGTWHNIKNTGAGELKLYTLYSTPAHKDGIIEATKADEKEEPFDGKTTE